MLEVHPQLAGVRVERAWGGNVALTIDRLPHCGRIDGLWYATGCNGSGVALNTWLGHRMAGALCGEPLPAFAELAHRPIPLHALAARLAARRVGVVPVPGQESVMKILVVGSGGVGSAFAMIARRRDFFEEVVLADLDEARARTAAERTGDPRFRGTAIDASDRAAVAECARAHGATHVLNAADPRFVMPIFGGAFDAGADLPRHGDVALARPTRSDRTRSRA